MGKGDWPKSDGDVLYASETNVLFNIVPIGAILPWAKSIPGVPSLPANFVECSGQTLSDADSPLNGQTIPNLNGNLNVLYGNSTSGSTRTEDFLPIHTHTAKLDVSSNYTGFQGNNASTGICSGINDSSATGTAWLGYSVVYIIRVK